MQKTPLYESHLQLGAKMISFAGWKMPFSYKAPKDEHLNVRQSGGLFDVSHMGELRVKGKDSLKFLEFLVPTDLSTLCEGQAKYSVLCDEQAGLIDDLIIYCLKKDEEYFLCVNAGTKEKDKTWLESHTKDLSVEIIDESSRWGMIAVQGPKSIEFCSRVFPSYDLSSVKRFHFTFKDGMFFSRTGYTGEDGFEIYIPWDDCAGVWESLVEKGKSLSILPIGLGARDTLRLEMGYLLSGQDFDEKRNLFEVGLSWIFNNPKDYLFKKSLLNKEKEGVSERLQGFVMEEDLGVPRKGYSVLSEQGAVIGEVTSGAKSPSLEKMIGLAYIRGQEKTCFIDIRGSKVRSRIVSGSFLKKEKRV